MKTIADPPEDVLVKVAKGRVAELSLPLFIAAAHGCQIREFLQEEAFTPAEVRHVRRISDCNGDDIAPGKILLLMPGWDQCGSTRETVEWWVAQDRYTVELETYPVPFPRTVPGPVFILIASLVVWAAIAAFVTLF